MDSKERKREETKAPIALGGLYQSSRHPISSLSLFHIHLIHSLFLSLSLHTHAHTHTLSLSLSKLHHSISTARAVGGFT